MPQETLFDVVADALQSSAGLDSLATRGTLRLALKGAGLDAKSVTPAQMQVVLERVLPGELERRGVERARDLCDALAETVRRAAVTAAVTQMDSPEDVFRRMRERRFGALFQHLPSLDLLARMTRRAALAGFAFSTVGLNLGIALAHAKHVPGFGYSDPTVLLTLVLWIHFGVIAFSEKIRGITARRASFAATAGLVALLVSLFLTLFPTLTFHSSR